MDSLSALKRKAKREKKHLPKEDDLDKLWFNRMTKEEAEYYAVLSMMGIYDRHSNTLMMGSDAIDRYLAFKKQMQDKYKL